MFSRKMMVKSPEIGPVCPDARGRVADCQLPAPWRTEQNAPTPNNRGAPSGVDREKKNDLMKQTTMFDTS